MVAHPEAFHTVGFAQTLLDLVLQVTTLWLAARVVLQVLHVSDGHLDDLCLLNSASTLLQVGRGDEAAEVCQAIVHPVPTSLLNDPVRHWVLGVEMVSERYFSGCSTLSTQNV